MNVICAAKDVCSALPAYWSLLLLVGAAPSLSPLSFCSSCPFNDFTFINNSVTVFTCLQGPVA